MYNRARALIYLYSEVNSSWLITSKLANHRARKALFTCVVYTNIMILECGRLLERACLLTKTFETEEGRACWKGASNRTISVLTLINVKNLNLEWFLANFESSTSSSSPSEGVVMVNAKLR